MEADELGFPDEPHEMAMHSQKIAVKHKLGIPHSLDASLA